MSRRSAAQTANHSVARLQFSRFRSCLNPQTPFNHSIDCKQSFYIPSSPQSRASQRKRLPQPLRRGPTTIFTRFASIRFANLRRPAAAPRWKCPPRSPAAPARPEPCQTPSQAAAPTRRRAQNGEGVLKSAARRVKIEGEGRGTTAMYVDPP